jgi:hypothetical protein
MSQTKAQLIDNLVQPITGALGSASAPTFSFTSDPNTGIYSPGADQLAISTNGTGRLFVDSTGRVGIGATSPEQILDVRGVLQIKNAGTTTLRFNDSTTNYWDIQNDSNLRFSRGGSEFARIDSSGRLGLGTSSPGDYNSNANTLVVGNTSSNQGITISAGTASASAIHFADGTAGDASYRGILKYEHSNDRFLFGTAGGNTALTIDSSQRVGIGTTSVVEKLDVVTGSGDCYVRTNNGTVTNYFGVSSSYTAGFIGTTSSHPLVLGAANAEKARLTTDGKLLVGTSTNYSGYKLQVVHTDATGVLLGCFNGGTNYISTLSSNGSESSKTVVTNGQELFTINVTGYDGSANRTAAKIEAQVDGTPGASDMPGRLVFSTTADGASSPTARLTIKADGAFRDATGVYLDATANATNMTIDSAGKIQRSTSSIKYKTDVEDAEHQYSDALLQCRPVWYRSTCESDNSAYSYWGFIAEEVAEIDPRLVHWKTTEPVVQENGSVEHIPCEPEPEGVAYDRFVPHLLNLIKRQGEAIAELQAEVAALKAS